ncbi:hypothetical protein Moror_6246 [Moniliophthora roreri MCA 2997]|nr:hypothetical protein Moror_6246 [Moniliophthora roreri MCA 2997]KAI3612096.1 hypothetical protein WG66_016300 [Moniliophthora roreri]
MNEPTSSSSDPSSIHELIVRELRAIHRNNGSRSHSEQGLDLEDTDFVRRICALAIHINEKCYLEELKELAQRICQVVYLVAYTVDGDLNATFGDIKENTSENEKRIAEGIRLREKEGQKLIEFLTEVRTFTDRQSCSTRARKPYDRSKLKQLDKALDLFQPPSSREEIQGLGCVIFLYLTYSRHGVSGSSGANEAGESETPSIKVFMMRTLVNRIQINLPVDDNPTTPT